jgi:hypothetical protein
MKQHQALGDGSGHPNFSRFAITNRDNMLRQALLAALIAHYIHLDAHLAEHPGSAPAVAMAYDLLGYLRVYVQGPLRPEIQLADWWELYRGDSRRFVDYLNRKTEALGLLTDLFAALKRLGLTVLHERIES